MKLIPFRCVAGASLMIITLIAAAGCSQQRTPYGQYLDAKARHDAAAAFIEAHGGSIAYEDPGTAVTVYLTDKPETRKALAAVADLFPVDSVTLIKTGVTNWELDDLGDLPALRHLTIRDAKLTQSGINYLEGRSHLTALHLFNTDLDDYRLTNIINKLPELKQLTVGYDPVTDTSVARLDRMTNLRRLTLVGTGATFDTAAKLIDTNPRLLLRFNDQTLKGPEVRE